MMRYFKCNIRCDNRNCCGWHKNNVNYYEWKDKNCPCCGTVLITHKEKIYMLWIQILCVFGFAKNVTGEDNSKEENIIKIDSKHVREEQ